MNQAVQEFWAHFLSLNPNVPDDTHYQVWYFGNTPELAVELGRLVIAGKKVATASLAAINKAKPEEAPIPDGYSVVTDYDGDPLCVIKTVEIHHLPFEEVDDQFAADEGEGDQTLEYWRSVHRQYFQSEAAEIEVLFDERSTICCERFKLLFPK